MQTRGSVSGFDNTAEQECENLICTHPGNNATCTEEGSTTASAGGAKRTCEQCFKTFLTPDQITGVLNGRTPESACPVFRGGLVLSESEFRGALGDAKVNPTIANELIACLRDAWSSVWTIALLLYAERPLQNYNICVEHISNFFFL